ncbi:MAG: hypothetical protein IBX53_02085 [Halomonas sp.]|uniref:hypothetical protein n=1 Tax=Halomonas sp. TaxID=1486246 RepID=UPI001A0F0A18|nr:hypothetical protein [Halomonas sp.]MBE0487841.1 hypothetical protein [Halomonas sp.]
MSQTSRARASRFKVLALVSLFALPLLVAWAMVTWRVGIPEQRTAHGDLAPDIPALSAWPLVGEFAPAVAGDWVLAFDCSRDCAVLADQWWRLHRALGREAPRVSRLRVGGDADALPGEAVANWTERPVWHAPDRLWVLDPQGLPVLAYGPEVSPRDVLDDVNRLLRMNPEVLRREEPGLAGR